MIKSTFYNLPDEKRERVIKAIVQEFSSSETEKVSINRIIKAANISRGSFYQYFDDKIDLVEVLMKSLVDIAIKGILQAISVSNGDVFYVYRHLFEIITDFSNDETKRTVLKNLIKNIRSNDNLISEYLMTRFNGFEELKDINLSYSRDRLRFKSDEDLQNLQQILNSVLKNAIFNYFVAGQDYTAVKNTYFRKLELIKLGAEIQ